MGCSGLSRISFQSLDLMRTANLLGSKVGRLTMASTSPDRGSSATTEPFLPCIASSATVCTSRSMVSCRSLPSTAFLVASVWRTWPRLSTTTWRWPSTPISESLYCFSMPTLPTTSPWLYLANSGSSRSCSLISPVYPMTCASMPFCGYHNQGKGEFQDVSVEAGMGLNTRFVGWGCGFFDFDNDGWPDLLLVNGHAFPEVDRLKIDIHYRDRAILYRNDHGKFVDISESAGPGILEKHSSRGLAFADYGNDGSVEALVNNQNEPPSLLRVSKSSNHWIELKLEGVKWNRSAIGARLRVTAGGLVQTAEVRSGGSYLSQSDLRLHFGLAGADKVDKLEIAWPSGGTQVESA